MIESHEQEKEQMERKFVGEKEDLIKEYEDKLRQ